MKTRHFLNLICFSPEGASGGEGSATAASAGADKAAAAEANAAAGSADVRASTAEGKGGGEKPGAASSDKANPAADAGKTKDASAKDGAVKDAAASDYAALLANVPEALRGKDVPETLQKVLDGQKHFRDHIGKHGLPPEKIEDYGFKPTEKLAADFFTGSEADQKLTNGVLEVFKEHGVGKMQAQGLLNGILEKVVTTFDLEPALNVEKERTALLPVDARGLPPADQKAAIDKRVDEATAFVNTLERQGLDAGAVNQLAGLLDKADGVRLVEFIRANIRGDGLALNGEGNAASSHLAALEKQMEDPRYRDDPKFRTNLQNEILKAKGLA